MKKQLKSLFTTTGLILTLIIILLATLSACETPHKIIETYTTDSAGRTVKTIQEIYSDGATIPVASINVSSAWYPPGYFYPYYYAPRIITPVRPFYTPRVIITRRH